MNTISLADFGERFAHRLRLRLRVFDMKRRSDVFSKEGELDSISRIYVINLDRKAERWRRVRNELDRFRDRHGNRLSAVVRRFSAIDSRYLNLPPDSSVLTPIFTLADQLTVDPHPLLRIDDGARAREISMTRQEVAVALSHIEVWRLIAEGDVSSALVIEDDVFLVPGFARILQRTWSLMTDTDGTHHFELLYLAFKDLLGSETIPTSQPKRRHDPGVWEAAGYVLTREGARKLLEQLPVHGPIDLWMNLQFEKLRVYTAPKPVIEQRIDEPSTNVYSVLPVLSQVGVITREKPLVPKERRLAEPIIALGAERSGLTALAKALSMVGYTCLSDIDVFPLGELERLRTGRKGRIFNAYVNIGSIDSASINAISDAYPQALFIATSEIIDISDIPEERLLHLGCEVKDKWAALSKFLKIEYPSFPYPQDVDLGYRRISDSSTVSVAKFRNLKFDRSPWILRKKLVEFHGMESEDSPLLEAGNSVEYRPDLSGLDSNVWRIRDDTFPSNLALFRPKNFSERKDGLAVLMFQEENTSVRRYTSAAIASRQSYTYGSFGAALRPSNVSGLITGIFLHRNNPRQEIDIEFLGKDTTKMLVNVYYNPGPAGTKLEYGYRGTPTEVDLGFDAAAECHFYEIEWHSDGIRWKVDGVVVYQRNAWNPTPIPDQPLEFNVNLWHSRSREFAGSLAKTRIPSMVEIHSLRVCSALEPNRREYLDCFSFTGDGPATTDADSRVRAGRGEPSATPWQESMPPSNAAASLDLSCKDDRLLPDALMEAPPS